jgi:signal transduction histidine kinase
LPGLHDRGELIGQARGSGLTVSLDVEGEERPLPVGVDLAAYRVLQEALTNVRKHAPGARTEVRIRYAASELELEVRDNGAAAGAVRIVNSDGGGHGLIGMRERVALYGGELEAGPLPEGGFRVRVRLPLAEGSA